MKTKFLLLAVLTLALFACQTENEDVFLEESIQKEIEIKAPTNSVLNKSLSVSLKTKGNGLLKSSDNRNIAVYMAEYITPGDSNEMGNTIFFNNNGNKQLGADFVPGLALDGTNNISYYVDDNRPSGDLLVSVTNNAIDRAMTTWDNVTCSDLGMFENSFDANNDTGFIARQLSNYIYDKYDIEDFFGGSFDYFADVTHAGWMPPLFFDFIANNGSNYILGVTFTIIFTDASGNPVDTDNNGKIDVAFREIYYNDKFTWDDGNHYDVETIALHEAGHGLSQGHFGKAFRNNGGLHFSPRAVMNAAYSGIQTSIKKTDNGGHCSNWAQWPNN